MSKGKLEQVGPVVLEGENDQPMFVAGETFLTSCSGIVFRMKSLSLVISFQRLSHFLD